MGNTIRRIVFSEIETQICHSFSIASSLRLISLRSHPIFELALKKVDMKLCAKFQLHTSNSLFRNRNTKYVIAFILRARYASFRFTRTPYLTYGVEILHTASYP